MAAEQEPGKFGAYGKIPSLGDFFRISLSQAFVEPWDAFLQAALVAGRTAKAEGWTDCYMTAPIWRFALAPGVAGPDPMLGVLMPSVDRVGRQFPLTLAAKAAGSAVLRNLILQGAVLHQLETIALDALDDDMGREDLASRLEALSLAQDPLPGRLRPSAGGHIATGQGAEHLALDLVLQQAARTRAVFATAVEGASRLMTLSDLPQGAAAAALFDLDASFWGEGRG